MKFNKTDAGVLGIGVFLGFLMFWFLGILGGVIAGAIIATYFARKRAKAALNMK